MPSPPATAHQGTTDLGTSVATELPRVAGSRGVHVRCSSAQSYPAYEYWRFDNAHVHLALPPIASPSSPNFVGSHPRKCKACQLTTAPYSRTFSPTIWAQKRVLSQDSLHCEASLRATRRQWSRRINARRCWASCSRGSCRARRTAGGLRAPTERRVVYPFVRVLRPTGCAGLTECVP